MNNSNNNTIPTVIIYLNAKTDRSSILSNNKGRAGIYMWTHLESGRIYVGSAFDLSKRLKNYYSPTYLKWADNYISRALLFHTHSAFSLSILEYIDITNLSVEGSRVLVLEREQFYLDLVFSEGAEPANTYNILKTAGSLIGYKHTEESLAKMKGRTNSAETIAKMSEAQKSVDRTGENHPMYGKTGALNPMYGKTHTTDTKALISAARKGSEHTEEAIAKISAARGGGTIYVYDTLGIQVNSFSSARRAAEFFNCSQVTILKYVRNGKLFKNNWKLYTSLTSS